jgi:hypothetical protein
VFDFTGGSQDQHQPILQIVATSSPAPRTTSSTGRRRRVDQGNIFLHVHRNGAPDSSAAISGGHSGGDTSEVTILGNLFYDCDNAVTAKQGNFYTLLHNTIVRVTKAGGLDFDSGVVNMRDTTPDLTTFGLGCYLEGNIVVDAGQLVRNYDPQQTAVTFNQTSCRWRGPDQAPAVDRRSCWCMSGTVGTYFSRGRMPGMRAWFGFVPDAPAYRAGADSRSHGVIPLGAAIRWRTRRHKPPNWRQAYSGPHRTGGGCDDWLPGAQKLHALPVATGWWGMGETTSANRSSSENLANGPHQSVIG